MVWDELVWFDMVWFDMVWFDMVWFDMVWFDMVWFDMVWDELVWFDLVWFDMVWDELVWDELVWFDLVREYLVVASAAASGARFAVTPGSEAADRSDRRRSRVWPHGRLSQTYARHGEAECVVHHPRPVAWRLPVVGGSPRRADSASRSLGV